MTSLRRSSRTKAQEAEAAASASAPSTDWEGHGFALDIPPDVAIDQLQPYLPEHISLSSPTPEAIIEIYRVLLDVIQRLETTETELDTSRAGAQRREIEVEQIITDSEKEISQWKAEFDQTRGELGVLKTKYSELEHVKDTLQLQISSLSSNQSTSSSEVNTLRQKVEETERANRDLINVVDRMKVFEVDQQQELDTLRERQKSTRHEVAALQTENAELKSSDATNKFKVETLNQEINLVREENDRYRLELDEKVTEFATFRRSKHAEVVALQSELESLRQNSSSGQSSLEALRQSYSALSQSHTSALQKINDLKADLADQESKFRSELSTQQRLVSLLEGRNEDARQRVQEVDSEWEKMIKSADDREAELHNMVEKERQKVDALQQRVDDLRAVIDKMGTGELPVLAGGGQGLSSSAPGTPGPVVGGLIGSMMLSPTANLATRFQKGGRSFTEVYADYVRLQAELAAEKQESNRLSECLTQILSDIEERAPTLQEQRLEYERMQREIMRLGPQLTEALEERELESANARVALDRAAAKDHENALLERQLSDMGRQLRQVLRELAIRDDPTLENEDIDDGLVVIQDVTDTDTIITDQLTLFRSLPELQDQNQRLLRITREMSAKMEALEKEQKDAADVAESEAIRRAKVMIEGLHGKIRGQETAERSLRKEIDMLSGMLSKARQGVILSAPGNLPERQSAPDSMISLETDRLSEMSSVLKEMGATSARLQDDLSASQKQVAELGVGLAKANAQIDFLNDRYRSSEETNLTQRRELNELQKRSSTYQGQISNLEIACHQARDQAREANAMLDRLRSEAANLRAERSLLKDVESRLSTDVANLTKDNSRLNSLLRDSQTIHEDINRSIDAERRRLENHIQSLETQSQDMRVQLNKELERNRHLTLQKDVEVRELQSRIDSAYKEQSATRETLVIAQTNEKHLTDRIDDLRRTLEGNHEKLAVYERRPQSGALQDLSSEDELKREVAELRAALKEAELDVETAKDHADQYKAISETNEEALADLQRTYEDYKASTIADVTRLQAEVGSLQERIQTLDRELVSNAEITSALRRQLEEQKDQFEAEKRDLEYALADVNSAESNAAALQVSVQDDLRRQTLLAQDAHEKYERELMAHADAVKTVSEVKSKLASLQTTLHEHQTSAETARANLLASQASWESQKEILDKEVHDLRIRYADINEQNSLLHQHLESVSSQATSIRHAADQRASLVDTEVNDGSSDALGELRAVVAYLRREKEVVDLQLDLSRQETTRLRSQVDHLRREIDEARAQLSKEREQSASTVQTAAQHSELLDKINQLNILRESNSTLRAESEAHGRKVHQLEEQLRKAQAEVGPLKRDMLMAQAELGAREDQIKVLEVECERWKTRNSQLLSQYKQVDPEDLRLAKEEADTLRKASEALRADYDSLQLSKDKLYSSFQALRTQSKNIIDNQKLTIATTKAENESLTARITNAESNPAAGASSSLANTADTLKRDLSRKEQELEVVRQEKITLEARVAELSKSDSASNQMDIDGTDLNSLEAKLAQASEKLGDVEASFESAQLAWLKEKEALELKVSENVALQEKHKLNARKFFADLKAAKKALTDAGMTHPSAPTVTTLPMPVEPVVAPSIPAAVEETTTQASVREEESKPEVATTSSGVPSIAKVEPGDLATEAPDEPKVAPLPLGTEVKSSSTPQPVTTSASKPDEEVPSNLPTSGIAAASAVPAPATLDRQAILRERLAQARKTAPPRSAATGTAPEPSTSTTTPTIAADSGPTVLPAVASSSAKSTPTAPSGRGRGARGVARGVRGGAVAGRGRGGAAPGQSQPAPATSGLSISGAAKRPLEDGADSSDGAQKRIRVQRINRQPGGGADAS